VGIAPWLLWLPAATAIEVSVPFEAFSLDNGLQVIMAPDHDLPLVQVNVWYGVGSKDEPAGRSGLAHLFEHLMFQGSAHQDEEYFGPLQAMGGSVNGTTNADRTNYFERVPTSGLDLALWMEADRMGWLLPALTQEKLDNQREVVRNERRQRYETRPYGTSRLTLLAALYPEGHPYHHATIGEHADLEAATLGDVRAFFETFYLPNNASLAICGDFDPAQARRLVERYFGDVPAGPAPARASDPAPALEGEVVIRQVEAHAPHPRVWITWHSPALFAHGDAALDALAALLSDGATSHLERALVRERRIARDVSAYQTSRQLSSTFTVRATAAAGRTTDELVAAIDALLTGYLSAPPPAGPLAAVVANIEADYLRDLRTLQSRANRLNYYATFAGDPGYLDEDLARYAALTPAAVVDAGRRWLGAERGVLHIEPGG